MFGEFVFCVLGSGFCVLRFVFCVLRFVFCVSRSWIKESKSKCAIVHLRFIIFL